MKENFGCDGQPGSYTDIEHCDAIFLYGHNMPETQTVLWMRILDRTRAEDPPRIVCVDPRRTKVAEEAERTGGVHLAPRPGTNQALMNGLTRELLVNGWYDEAWVDRHVIGLDELRTTVEPYTPEAAARICGIAPGALRAAARIFGESNERPQYGAAGLLPVASGHQFVVRRPQPAPASRDDRPPRRRHSADERAAHRAEQPRVRRRR
jgi:anaerobic selenocysteine-containing dehydrogenase